MIYIDAEQLQDGLYNIKDGKIYKYKAKGGTVRTYKLENRPQGEWKDRTYGGRILHPWWESCECSQCEEWGSGAWNFCPNCGCRMKGADDD